MASVNNYGSSLTIEELTGRSGGQPRAVILFGPSLPFMGAEWGFENNLITTWYPGNATEATQQVLGPRELPSTWEGEWNRTKMGKVPTRFRDETGAVQDVVSPMVLREVLEDIARAGARLRVTWSVYGNTGVGSPVSGSVNDAVQLVREGRIKSFKTPIDRHTDVRWTIEFHWVSRGGTQDRVVGVRTDNDLSTVSNGLEAGINALQNKVDSKIGQTLITRAKGDIRRSANRFTLGQLESLADGPRRAVAQYSQNLYRVTSQFKQIGDIAKKVRSAPFQVANGVIDLGRNTAAISNQFIDEIGREPVELKTHKNKVSDLGRSSKYFTDIVQAAMRVARLATEMNAKILGIEVSGNNLGALTAQQQNSSSKGDIIAIYVTKAGDTPQSIAKRFYKNPDRNLDILRTNRLPWTTPTFRPGTILVIPQLTTAPRSA